MPISPPANSTNTTLDAIEGSINFLSGEVEYLHYGYNVSKVSALIFAVLFGISTSQSHSPPRSLASDHPPELTIHSVGLGHFPCPSCSRSLLPSDPDPLLVPDVDARARRVHRDGRLGGEGAVSFQYKVGPDRGRVLE